MQVAICNHAGRFAGQGFRMKAGIAENREAFAQLANGGGPELVGMRHRAGSFVDNRQIAWLQSSLASLLTCIIHGRGNAVFHFAGGVVGESMAEILHDVQPVSATNHAQPDHVVGRVEQVRAVRRGKHEMLMSVLGVRVERNVFSLLIELEMSGRRQPLRELGLAVELMRQSPRCQHGPRVNSCSLRKFCIQGKGRRSRLPARLVG